MSSFIAKKLDESWICLLRLRRLFDAQRQVDDASPYFYRLTIYLLRSRVAHFSISILKVPAYSKRALGELQIPRSTLRHADRMSMKPNRP